jgi:transglutaminase-like putative cysteine protease
MREFLQSSRFIRSDDSSVVEKAGEIVGGEKDPIRAARLINRWVHDNLKKVPTPAVPDAVAVLESKQGDCNEHAILAAALARAVGLPTRVTVGLVHTEDGFCYHAWVDYWTGNRWLTGAAMANL